MPKMKRALKPVVKSSKIEKLHNDKHLASVVAVFPDAFVSGQFCDVKIVCMDTSLWAHRIILTSVSPFIQKLLEDYEEKQGDDVITLLLPMIKGYHMKLVLDYIYSGAMYLCGFHMQYVIQVMEVLQLKCGVSVNKIVGGDSGKMIEVEHSTVTIKTDKDAELHVNGVKEEEDTVRSAKRRRSTNIEPQEPVRLVKRKKLNSDVENNSVEKKNVSSNNCQPDKSSNLEILSVPIKKPQPNGSIDDKEVENLTQPMVSHSESKSNNLLSEDEDEDGNDVVTVELDEEFAVEKIDKEGAITTSCQSQDESNSVDVIGDKQTKSHRCALCGRTFKHYANLQVHLTGHLGVKVNIHRCNGCKKNFRNQTELDLHMRAHRAAKFIGKYKTLTKGAGVKHKAKPVVITTSGTTDKKIIRKYMKSKSKTLDSSKASKSELIKKKLPANNNKSDLTCVMCDKSFGVKSLYLRHVKKFHPDLSETLESHIQLKTSLSINIKKCALPPRSPPKKFNAPTSPRKALDSPAVQKSPKSSPVTPASGKTSKKKERRSTSDSLTPSLPDYYSTLECPDCSKSFVAKSIFERHLQSAKHGMYAHVSPIPDTDSSFSPPVPAGPHWTQLPLAPASEDGNPVPKIKCHLCNQTFMRVKDLEKHRDRMCPAYHA